VRQLDDHLRYAFAILVKGENSVVDFDLLVCDMIRHLVDSGSFGEGELNFGDQLDPLDVMGFLIEKIGYLFGIYPFTLSYQKEMTIKHMSTWGTMEYVCHRRSETMAMPYLLLHLGAKSTWSDLSIQSLIDGNTYAPLEECLCETHRVTGSGWEELLFDERSNYLIVVVARMTNEGGVNRDMVLTNKSVCLSDLYDDVLDFRLRALVCHYEEDAHGHFITYVFEDNRIIKISDSVVSVATRNDIRGIDTHSYILAYERCDESDAEPGMINDVRRYENRDDRPVRESSDTLGDMSRTTLRQKRAMNARSLKY
jgi:hypothetical protein